MLQYSRQNNGYKYILVVLDAFSRKNWVRALKTKEGDETAAAIDEIITEMPQKPRTLASDIGSELINKAVKRTVVDKYGMVEFRLVGKTKATLVERFNRTLGQRIQRYFMEKNTTRWVDRLQDFSKAINDTVNRTLGVTPNSINLTNWHQTFNKLYKSKSYKKIICKFSVGDKVRVPIEIAKEKQTFRKGTLAKWSKEIYTVLKSYQSGPICYFKLNRDISAKKQFYYENELNLVARMR